MQKQEPNTANITNSNTSNALTDEDCYRALTSKDIRFDGVFFTGVKTTGIYCRPICGVKTPKLSSCTFFTSAASAEAAGFRPCLRCRPELAPYALQQNLAHAIWQKIAAGELNGQSLENLSAQIGLSSRQVRRVLLQEFGVGPTEIAQTQRLLFAKKLIQETDLAMSEVAFAAGFGSVRRFNALFQESYQLTPNALRRDANAQNKLVFRARINSQINLEINSQSSSQPSSQPSTKSSTKISTQEQGICLRLSYRPPYAWSAMMQYLNGRAMPNLETVNLQTQTYQRVVQYGAYEGWYQVSHSAAHSQLIVHLSHDLSPVLMPVLALIRAQFDVEANPSIIAAHLDAHYVLAKQLQITPGLRVPGTFSLFELAIRAILGQQVSVAGATTVSGRLVRHFGKTCITPWAEITHHFPSAHTLANASVSDIAQLGMPSARANTIRQFAQFVVDGGLEKLAGKPLDHVLSQLKTLPGIGEWTAQYIAMRGFRFPNAFPAGDLGLQKAVSLASLNMLNSGNNINDINNNNSSNSSNSIDATIKNNRCTEKQLLAQSLAWSPWRSYAALLLWQSLTKNA